MKSCTDPVYVEALGVYCDVQLLGMLSWTIYKSKPEPTTTKDSIQAVKHTAKSPRRRSDKDLYLTTLSIKHLQNLHCFNTLPISLHRRRAIVTLRSIWALLLVVHAEDMAQLVCHVPGLGTARRCMGLKPTFLLLKNQRWFCTLGDLFG